MFEFPGQSSRKIQGGWMLEWIHYVKAKSSASWPCSLGELRRDTLHKAQRQHWWGRHGHLWEAGRVWADLGEILPMGCQASVCMVGFWTSRGEAQHKEDEITVMGSKARMAIGVQRSVVMTNKSWSSVPIGELEWIYQPTKVYFDMDNFKKEKMEY